MTAITYPVAHVVESAFNFQVGADTLAERIAFFVTQRDAGQFSSLKIQIEWAEERRVVWVRTGDLARAFNCPEAQLVTDKNGFLAVRLAYASKPLGVHQEDGAAAAAAPTDDAAAAPTREVSFLHSGIVDVVPDKVGGLPTIYVGDAPFGVVRVASHEVPVYGAPDSTRELTVTTLPNTANHPLFDPSTYEKLKAVTPPLHLPVLTPASASADSTALVSTHAPSLEHLLRGPASPQLDFPTHARALLQQLRGLHDANLFHRCIEPRHTALKDGSLTFGPNWDALMDLDDRTKHITVVPNPRYCAPGFWNKFHLTPDAAVMPPHITRKELAENDVYALGLVLLQVLYGSAEERYPDEMNSQRGGINPLTLPRYQAELGETYPVPQVEAPPSIRNWDDLVRAMLATDPTRRPDARTLYERACSLTA